MLYKRVRSFGELDHISFAMGQQETDSSDAIPDSEWLTEKDKVIISLGHRSFSRLDKNEAIDLAKFLLRCASIMNDENE